VAAGTRSTYAWVGIVVDLLLILVGSWMISQGWWTDFAEVLVGICSVGLVVSIYQLWRAKRSPADS
jgi:hypothetical protein